MWAPSIFFFRAMKQSAFVVGFARLVFGFIAPGALLLSGIGCSDVSRSVLGAAPASKENIAVAEDIFAQARPLDVEGEACQTMLGRTMQEAETAGTPEYDANRIEILGRAKGEPVVLMREPKAAWDETQDAALLAEKKAFERGHPGGRVHSLARKYRLKPQMLRTLLLREGYAYSNQPQDALGLITALSLPALFDEPEIWLLRGSDVRKLVKRVQKKEVSYVYVDGPLEGRVGDLLFGDRVGLDKEELIKDPLHRDMRALSEEIGFDRAKLLRRTEQALAAELRFGSVWAKALITSEGAKLKLSCLAENKEKRDQIAAYQQATAGARRSFARMHEVVEQQLKEVLRFDRPEGEKTADRDGFLRPLWATAYFQGRDSFQFEKTSFQVFTSKGDPWPPQVCVDFVLDTFERSSGSWYSPKGQAPKHIRGKLDFNDAGIQNRRGVIAFGDFAESKPDLFTFRRFAGAERIPFGERTKYFQFLLEHADEVRMGDVVAIHGLKRDERIHQHAILVEYSDPMTGFPYGLADQMKKPRRRTWEGIMAEAPKRSLLYRARPTQALLEAMDPGPAQ